MTHHLLTASLDSFFIQGITSDFHVCYTGEGLDDLLMIPNSANTDPTPMGTGGQETTQRDACLKQRNFLLYLATTSGGKAIRNLMIPRLMSSLKKLKSDECITQACIKTNNKIEKKLNVDYPNSRLAMIPKYECTFTKRFCIAQEFIQKSSAAKSQKKGQFLVIQ